MRVAVPRETAPGENRGARPRTVSKLRDAGFEVTVERGAGEAAGFPNTAYAEAGADLADPGASSSEPTSSSASRRRLPRTSRRSRRRRCSSASSSRSPTRGDRAAPRARRRRVRDGVHPADHEGAVDGRALLAGDRGRLQGSPARGRPRPKLFPMLMTAAGTIAPVRALVIGAGVAGLQAIATAAAWVQSCPPSTCARP